MNTPLVSIVMPVYNTGDYLSDAIKSVLHQTPFSGAELPSFELLLVDDGSTDLKTLSILEQAVADAKIRVFRNTRSKGVAGARNTAIEAANGEWIAFLDSDDLWVPTSLACRWKSICEHPQMEWLGARFSLLKPTVSLDGVAQFPRADELLLSAPKNSCSNTLRLARPVALFGQRCMIGIMTVLIKKQLLVKKGLFSEQLPRAEDYHMWFCCAFSEDLWFVEEEVGWYRIHNASLTHGNAPRHMYEENMVELLESNPEAQPFLSVLKHRLDVVMQDHCYFYRRNKKFGTAFLNAIYWVRKRPLKIGAWKEIAASVLRIS